MKRLLEASTLTATDYIKIGTLAVALIAWLVRIEVNLNNHIGLGYHDGMPGFVESRVDEKVRIVKAEENGERGRILAEIGHLKQELTELKNDLKSGLGDVRDELRAMRHSGRGISLRSPPIPRGAR